MRVFSNIPLLLVPFGFYHGVTLMNGPGVDFVLYNVMLRSGGIWAVTTGTLILTLGLSILLFEIYKATKTTTNAPIIDHLLSMILLLVGIVEFLLVPEAGTSTFFLLLGMMAVDVIGGFTISYIAKR